MRKTLFVLFFLTLISCAYGLDFKICIYPNDAEVRGILENTVTYIPYTEARAKYFADKIFEEESASKGRSLYSAYQSENPEQIEKAVYSYIEVERTEIPKEDFKPVFINSDKDIDPAVLASGSTVVLNTFADMCDADFVVITEREQLSDFQRIIIHFYDRTTGTFTKVSDTIDLMSERIPESFNDVVTKYFGIENTAQTEPAFIFKTVDSVQIQSDPSSEVYINGVSAGETPLLIDSVTVPAILTLKADNFSDYRIDINENTHSVNVRLKPNWLSDGNLYQSARTKFYESFARTIVSIGVKALFKAFSAETDFFSYADNAMNGVIGVSIVDTVYRLFDYYKYADFVSP